MSLDNSNELESQYFGMATFILEDSLKSLSQAFL